MSTPLPLQLVIGQRNAVPVALDTCDAPGHLRVARREGREGLTERVEHLPLVIEVPLRHAAHARSQDAASRDGPFQFTFRAAQALSEAVRAGLILKARHLISDQRLLPGFMFVFTQITAAKCVIRLVTNNRVATANNNGTLGHLPFFRQRKGIVANNLPRLSNSLNVV